LIDKIKKTGKLIDDEIDVVYENNAEFEINEFLNDTNIPDDIEVKETE